MKKVRVVKLEELKDAEVPNNKEVGYFKEGFMMEECIPQVGRQFLLFRENGIPMWQTSTVTEIIDNDIFKTRNSIYQIILL
jgi:hypothetical protein